MGYVDLLSLDIDGNDYWVLENLDFSGISIVVCEYNPIYGSKGAYTVARNDQFDRTSEHSSWLHYGMSLMAAITLMKNNGLIFVGSNRAGNNAFFIQEHLVQGLTIEIPNLQNLEIFVDWRVRESRDKDGNLNYLSGAARLPRT